MKNSTFVLKKNDVPRGADGNFRALKKIKVKFHSLDLIMSCRLYCRLNQMVGLIPGTLPHINEC